MIELHLIEDKIFYGVVEEFLFTKITKNSNYKDKSIFGNNYLFMCKGNTLAECLKWVAEAKKKKLINPVAIVRFQKTDNNTFSKVLRSYTYEEVEKYLILI